MNSRPAGRFAQQSLGGYVLVVNYNQAQEIRGFLQELERSFAKDRCVVVDDGSTDDSPAIAEEMGFRVLRHPKNLGVGAAIRSGLDYGQRAGYEWVLVSASSGKMRPNEFERVYGPVERGEADYVQGSRFLRSGASPGLTVFRRLMIPVFSFFASVLLGRRFTDATCGLRCYRLAVLRDPEVNVDQEWLNRYELEYYLHFKAVRSKKYRIIEVPVTMKYDHIARGRLSKIRPFTDWWSMARPFLILALKIRK